MTPEHWSLLISALALVASVGLPLGFRWADSKRRVRDKRQLLLQKILSVKSIVYSSRFHLIYLLKRYADQMEASQRQALERQVPALEKYERELWKLHEIWRDSSQKTDLKELAEAEANVDVTESEVSDLAKLIEDGAESYE